ncbi:DJ-1/PfpI family protein [Corynebacterium halotolerans]|uniref:DJ-1/PfpI domain-containing protein n=1 Tax=Corynebacterium halotolerans YIM 70093 = DSM 44683 TaxID=1121362 RepID=M1NIH1_9CORY|nr:DJ-1/PfpI family protein [Corynebacterium halotolerans]AGF71218.1 hypothetical protein A605_01010 [Corynebacterium halotolerans YIM 70093 = DSM 44683]
MRRAGFLVFDSVTMLDVSGPAEVFSRARGYELVMLSPSGADAATGTGTGLTITGALPVTREVAATLDTVIIPGSDTLPERPWDPDLLDAAAVLADGPGRVARVRTGAFILAELGLLDGRRATTHWRNARDSGFGSGESLRRAFDRHLQTTPSESGIRPWNPLLGTTH